MIHSLPTSLLKHDRSGYWGVSPESIALAVNARHTDDEAAHKALDRYFDVEVLRTNYRPDQDEFNSALETIAGSWFPEPLDQTAMFATPETVGSLVAGAAYYDTPSGVASVLVHGQDLLEGTDPDERLVMSKRDLHGYAETEKSRSLLKSLGIIRAVPEGYELNRTILNAISTAVSQSRQEAAYQLLEHVIESLGIDVDQSLIEELLDQFNITPPTSVPAGQSGCLSVLVRDNALTDFVDALFGAEFEQVLSEQFEETTRKRDHLRRTQRFVESADPEPISRDWPFSTDAASICSLASQRDIPVAAGWLANQTDTRLLKLADELDAAGFAVRYDTGLLYFDEAYAGPDPAPETVETYNEWVVTRLSELDNRVRTFERLQARPRAMWDVQRQRLLETSLATLDSFIVSPMRFIYTIFDPEFHVDSYDIEQYIGDSPELEREVETIRRWRENRPHDADSFADVVPEVLNHPIEHPNAEPRVRIMSPWTNFAIKEYVGLFKRLLDKGVKIDILFRLPSRSEWANLKNNLLTRLGDTKGNLELRSYTRYKEYHDHTELRELEKTDEYLSEIGVHAKLFIGGDAENGNVVAGSANLMENSFYYNPEAGIQTRNPNVVETAIDYFDLVWELSVHDRISEDTYTGETQSQYYPRLYRPR